MSLRVTAGTARGRALHTPKSDLRPTTDKVKQAIFSMLEAEALRRGYTGDEDRFASAQAWPRVLDLFAGSGALGIEALSRGAEFALFVERDRAAVATIERNLEITGLRDRAAIRRSAVEPALASMRESFDLILLDPPYKDKFVAVKTIERIVENQILAPRGMIVWEHERSAVAIAPPKGIRSVRHRAHGVTGITVLEPEAQNQQGEYD